MILESPYAHGPFGAKGVGELPIDGPAPAIANALRHARLDVREIPATPERLMEAAEVEYGAAADGARPARGLEPAAGGAGGPADAEASEAAPEGAGSAIAGNDRAPATDEDGGVAA